ncbi:MAG: HEAT repeat domain-containing protein, partial [Candidatus Methanogasteraceae archaeon]
TRRIQHAIYPLSIADGVTKRNKNGINITGWMNVFSSAQDIPTIFRAMLNSDDWCVRMFASDTIELLRDSPDIQYFRETLKDSSCDATVPDTLGKFANALNVLKKLGNSEDLSLIRDVLEDECRLDAWAVHITTCKTFEALVDRENIPLVMDMLKNGGYYARQAAIVAFKKIGSCDDLPFIREMLKGVTEEVKVAALEILKEFGSSDDLPLIRKMLKDSGGGMQKALLDVISVLGTEDDLDLLVEYVRDPGKDASLVVETLIALDRRLYSPYNPKIS